MKTAYKFKWKYPDWSLLPLQNLLLTEEGFKRELNH
jgi:hypothetical protein